MIRSELFCGLDKQSFWRSTNGRRSKSMWCCGVVASSDRKTKSNSNDVVQPTIVMSWRRVFQNILFFHKESPLSNHKSEHRQSMNSFEIYHEHVHENTDARQRRLAKPDFRRRHGACDHLDLAVRRTDDQPGARRRHAIGISKKQDAPDRQDEAGHEKGRPKHTHKYGDGGEGRDKGPPAG